MIEREEVEQEIKDLLGIPYEETLSRLEVYKGGKYYRVETYSPERKGPKFYHVPKKKQEILLNLWHRYASLKEKEKKFQKELMELFAKYNIPITEEELKRIEELLKEKKVSAISYHLLKSHKTKAKELFNEFLETLVFLHFEGVLNRLTILQVLYLLANLKDMSQAQDRPEIFFKKGINTIIRVVRNERIPNPFGTLKNDFFLSGTQTPYDFLLSNFLEELIGETFKELLEKEVEKKKAQEEAREYKEKMERLKELVQKFEELPPQVKLLEKEVISENVFEIAEKFLKDIKESKLDWNKIENFIKSSDNKTLISYFEYLKTL